MTSSGEVPASGGSTDAASKRASEVIKPTVHRVAELLRPCGYRKRGNRFNHRLSEDGIIHVIAFQLASHRGFEPPGSLGLHPAYYGTYTINLGVYVPEVALWPPSKDGWVGDYDCPIRERIGTLLPASTDVWWPVGSVDAADVVIDALTTQVLPWLDRLNSVDAILRIHALAPELLRSRWQRWPFELYLSRGRDEEARQAFGDHLAYQPVPASYVATLREWLQKEGLHDWEPMLETAQLRR